MTTAALIFAVSFAVVFLLGVQQYNVTALRVTAAAFTSLLISAATLVQFKLLPGPTTWLDLAGYFFGSAAGICTSIWAYPRLSKRKNVKEWDGPYSELENHFRGTKFYSARKAAGLDEALPPPSDGAVKLGERLRLATTIADYASRADIESYCLTHEADGASWWNTQRVRVEDGIERHYVDNAVAYLHLRQRLVRHADLPYLVRFAK